MFGVGMHFSIADLMAVKRIAVPGALLLMVTLIIVLGAQGAGDPRRACLSRHGNQGFHS